MDAATRAAFVAHVKKLEALAIGGDQDASKSLACMALLSEGWRPDPDGGEVINLADYRLAA